MKGVKSHRYHNDTLTIIMEKHSDKYLDENDFPVWFAPAGVNRGGIKNEILTVDVSNRLTRFIRCK